MNVLVGLDGAPFGVVCLVKTTLMAAFVLLLMWATGHHNARWRVFVGRLGLLAIFAIPVLDIMVPGFAVLPELSGAKTANQNDSPSLGGSDSDVVWSVPDGSGYNARFTSWLGAIWIAGCAVIGARVAVQMLRLQLADRDGIRTAAEPRAILEEIRQQFGSRHDIDLQVSTSASTPYVWGLFKPVIVVPEELAADADETTWRAILAHETAHVCRGDLRWDTAFNLACILIWWHPLLWWIRGEHRHACEEVCDAVASCYVASVSSYSRILARVAMEAAHRRAALSMAKTSKIGRRLSSLRHNRNSRELSGAATLCGGLIVSLLAAGLAQAELRRKELQLPAIKKVHVTLAGADEYYLDGKTKALGLSELVETLLHSSSATAHSLDYHLTPAGITQEGVDRFFGTMRDAGLLDERSTLVTTDTLLRYARRPTLSRPPEDFDWRQIPGVSGDLPPDQTVVAVRVIGIGRFRVNDGPELTEDLLRQVLLERSNGKRLLLIYLIPEVPSESAFQPISDATLTLLDRIHKWGIFEGLERSGYHVVGDNAIRPIQRSRI